MTAANPSIARSAIPRTTAARWGRPRIAVGLAGLAGLAAPASALDVLPNEKATREACERRACEVVLQKSEKGPPLKCHMIKTWDRDKIKKNGEKKRMTWGFGDARCEVSLDLDRALLVPALTADKYTLQFPPQKVLCQIENSEKKAEPLTVVATPKIKFKGGHADKVWLNVKEVEGQSGVKTLVWTAAKLADGLGLFHKDTLKSINAFVHETCPTEFGGKLDAKAPASDKAAPKAAAAKSLVPAAKAETKPAAPAAEPTAPASPKSFRMEADTTAKPDAAKPAKAEAN